jgi:Fe/S biogenesis protein NfuA
MMEVTELAKRKVLEVAEAQDRVGAGLRITVLHGGTAMAEFGLQFVDQDEFKDEDKVHDAGDFKICMDPDSARFLEGAKVDFIEAISGAGFKIDAPNAFPPRPSGPVADKIQKVIDEKINPSLAGHGGRVVLEALKEDIAFLRFGGGCHGCGMVKSTLKDSVEVMIKEEVPEITSVRDITDHSTGDNPYYGSQGD